MPLLNYTTKIPYEKTIAQIEALLIIHGASGIHKKVDSQHHVCALVFGLETPNGTLPIKLPIEVEATHKVLKRQYLNREVSKRFVTEDHARRVAWRIIKDWLEAQVWLVETEMAKMEQIMLPYLVVDKEYTLYEVMRDRGFLLKEGTISDTDPIQRED